MTAIVGNNDGGSCNHAGCSARDCFSLHFPGDACARCNSCDSFPLHRARDHVNRTYFKLCSSCLLKIHATSFCCFCLGLTGDEKLELLHCSKCPSVSHLGCLPRSRISSELVCPRCATESNCSADSFSYLSVGIGKAIDLQSARAFLAASRIAMNALRKRAAAVNDDAEKRVKESAGAWKKARLVLTSANVVCKKEEEEGESGIRKERRGNEEEERKRKEQKRVPSREIEKWMRFHEPIPKGGFVESKSRVGLGSREEKGKKGSITTSLCKAVNRDP